MEGNKRIKQMHLPLLETNGSTMNEDSDRSINILPDECLILICSHLSSIDRLNMEKVCQSWKASVSPLIWNNITKFDARGYQQLTVERLITRCGRFLKDLILDSSCDYSIFPIVGEHCINLVNFDFGLRPNFEEMYFRNSFNNMKKLKSIKIWADDSNSIDNLAHIFHSIHNDIEEISFFTPLKYVKPMSKRWPNVFEKFTTLRKILMFHCELNDEIIDMINKKKTTLTELTLIYSCFWSSIQLDLPNLESLCLRHCPVVIENCLINGVPNNFKQLSIVNLGLSVSNDMISQETVSRIGKQNLKKLRLDNTSFCFGKLTKNLFNLKFLDCARCVAVTDSNIITVLKNCKNIQFLYLVGTSITVNTLCFAVDVVNQRERGPPLIISVNRNVYDDFFKKDGVIIPHLLAIKKVV
ncbi:hypothetical protein HCN44_000541 [Aphidius gifuensis]|uniref:F-box domain-containing protein n=1 Tax=Aphidius gifuensis TaxID=684658 RepID=A0A834XTX7_APHGI|nr:uncharacterized protein LOC122853747 [Aphidius gifuensis]KAF7990736.1 hypothetical protein HCN44_000541 [Aphidius gifuensis]